MEAKPIVTSHGNQSVLSMLQKPLLESLPKEPAEWRRSYGRPARNVQLEASFVPYDDDILPDDSVKTLVSRLYFHIFWTDCDLETYKVKVKEEITEWCAALKAKNISDWMIVILNSDETKNKTKLLPRTSVYDKIKSDFCSKQPERIVVLESLNGDQKSVSLWNTFVSRLRQLLLQAFTRHLQKYEDNMRALRERRNEVGWNFQEYFIVQEELAFMFEMLGLHEDAMIQYDELDALFTQFILNHASGRLRTLEHEFITQQIIREEVDQLIIKQLHLSHCIKLGSNNLHIQYPFDPA